MLAQVPYQAVEERLLLAATQPDELHAVVLLIWSSLVLRPCNGTSEPATPAGARAGAHPAVTPPPPLSASWSAATAAAEAPSLDDQTPSLGSPKPRLVHTMVGSVASVTASASCGAAAWPGTEDLLSPTPSVTLGDMEAVSSALLTASPLVARGPGLEWTGPAPNPPRSPYVVGLSPLILRVLLWWAGRPQLPSRRAALDVTIDDVALSSGSTASFTSSLTMSISAGGSHTRRAREDARVVEAAVAAGRPAADQSAARHPSPPDVTMGVLQLRHRIAEIFAVLCARDGGVVVSDALLYGRCHDSSQMAAQRCLLQFAPCPHARWRAATSGAAATAPLTAPLDAREGGGRRSAKSAARRGTGAYDITPLLCALVDLHTCAAVSGGSGGGDATTAAAAAAARTPPTPPQPTLSACRVGASADSDAVATGKLLRALLRCPLLHKRLARLFNGDPRAMKPRAYTGDASSSPMSVASPPRSLASPPNAEDGVPVRDLAAFAGALTHPSPVVSGEAWRTMTTLLFPVPSVGLSSAARRLLLLPAPRCPVQRLLISALALPGDDDEDHTTSGPPPRAPPSPVLAASHPMARNAALRLLHLVCASTDLPPAVQAVFQECPALLWRVLRLAAALCRGVPAASGALVRCVLVDYIVCAAPSPHQQQRKVSPDHRVGDGAASLTTYALLRANKTALTAFLTATRTAWGCDAGGAAAVPDGDGDGGCGVAASAVHISRGAGYDEGHVAAMMEAL